MPWIVSWQVYVDGTDRSDSFRPYLMQIDVSDTEGQTGDTCQLMFDDTAGQLKLPQKDAKLRVILQGIPVFEGTIDKVRSQGARGSGQKSYRPSTRMMRHLVTFSRRLAKTPVSK